MPEPVTTTQTTETTTPQPETYTDTGRTVVDDEVFLTEDETGEGETTTTPTETATTQPAQPTTPAPETAKTTQTTTPEKVYAGKYKSIEDLKSAFIQLGGDPAKYGAPEKLEEAYETRQAEYNRVKQENDERQRLTDQEAAHKAQQASQKAPEEVAKSVIEKLDFTKMDNAQDLVTQLIPALIAALPQPQPVDTNQLFEQFSTQSREREEKTVALTQLEKDVPRLAMTTDATGKPIAVDPTFRKAFAGFLLAGNYPRTTLGLQAAMKEFLPLVQGATAPVTTEQKNSAAAPTETAKQTITIPKKELDEADEIIGEYNKNQAKYA